MQMKTQKKEKHVEIFDSRKYNTIDMLIIFRLNYIFYFASLKIGKLGSYTRTTHCHPNNNIQPSRVFIFTPILPCMKYQVNKYSYFLSRYVIIIGEAWKNKQGNLHFFISIMTTNITGIIVSTKNYCIAKLRNTLI